MKENRATLVTFLAVLAVVLASRSSDASSLSLDPTRVHLKSGEAQALTLRNRSPFEVLIQTRVLSWSQSSEGDDILEDTDRLLVSPPIVRIPANSEKVVRVALRSELEGELEATFRLVLSEVLQKAAAIGGPGVRFAIQFNVPVFANRVQSPRPMLVWSIADQEDGSWKLQASNVGNGHVQIRSLALRCENADDADQLIGTAAKPAYLLPGARRSWYVTPTEYSCAIRKRKNTLAAMVEEVPLLNFTAQDSRAGIAGAVSESLDVIAAQSSAQEIDSTVLRIHAKTDQGDLLERIAVHVRKAIPIAEDVATR